jgi:predicted nucleic acid-binding protein
MIVDSNVVIDILRPIGDQSMQVAEAFLLLAPATPVRINVIIFAEACARYVNFEEAEAAITALGVVSVAFSHQDAFRAGQAFQAYRRNGGPRTAILPDFLIGAQASVRGWPILTRDPARFASYFPEVELIDPLKVEND